jgi:hypothetical protein
MLKKKMMKNVIQRREREAAHLIHSFIDIPMFHLSIIKLLISDYFRN